MKQTKSQLGTFALFAVVAAEALLADAIYKRGRKRGHEDSWHVIRGELIGKLTKEDENEKA